MARSKLTEEATVVRKANPAIAIRPTAGKLTIVSRRIYNLLLYHAQQQGIACEEYSLPLSYVVGQISSSENNASIKTRLREMASTTIEWNSNPTGLPEDQEWNIASLLAAKITPARQGKPITLTWSYAPGVRRQLVEPKTVHQATVTDQHTAQSLQRCRSSGDWVSVPHLSRTAHDA